MKIKKLHLDLTDHCNLSCVYCYVRKDRGGRCVEMKKEDWFEIIDQGVRMGISSFVISGGEPLIFPGFSEILKKLERYGSATTLMTNLSGVAEHLIDAVIESSTVKEIVTSLDGFEGHNIARLPSDWREVVRNIKRLKERRAAGCKVTVNTVLHISACTLFFKTYFNFHANYKTGKTESRRFYRHSCSGCFRFFNIEKKFGPGEKEAGIFWIECHLRQKHF